MIYLSNGSEVKSKTIISGMQTRSIVVKNLEFYKNSETGNRLISWKLYVQKWSYTKTGR